MGRIILLLFFALSCTYKICDNGATNHPGCNKCPPGKIFMDNQCAIQVTPEQPIQEKEENKDKLWNQKK